MSLNNREQESKKEQPLLGNGCVNTTIIDPSISTVHTQHWGSRWMGVFYAVSADNT
jgi:hypothetical protein